jgi:hypothetical protein
MGWSENVRVASGVIGGVVVSVCIAYFAAERPFSVSLIDRECRNAQEQYYRARNAALAKNNQVPPEDDKDRQEAHDHADICAQHRMADYAQYGAWLLFVSFFLTGWAAIASARAVKIANKTLIVSERAWLSIETFAIKGSLSNSAEGIRTNLVIELLNSGRSPAANVRIDTKICAQSWQSMDALKVLSEAALVNPSTHWRRRMLGETIAPGRPAVRELSILLETSEILSSLQVLAPMSWVVPAIVGCLTYRSAFDDAAIHQTGFIFELRRQAANTQNMIGIEVDNGGAIAGGDIPLAELRIFRTMVSGFMD